MDTTTIKSDEIQQDDLLLSMLGITSRAPSFAFDYLTVRDRVQLRLISKRFNQNLKQVEYHRCKDGRIYKVPFPGFPGLLMARDDEGLFPHQLASLQAMHKAENSSTEFGSLRGGILGDAPGLGKTITMLALITSTAGRRPQAPPEPYTQTQMQDGWAALSRNPGCDREILLVIKPFRRLAVYPRLECETKPPFPLTRFPTIQHFERQVRWRVRSHGVTDMELEQFRQNLNVLKAGLHKSYRKLLKSPAGRRQAWERTLVPTCATLLIVPDALLEHWFVQIRQNIRRDLFDCTERGVVYLDGVGDIVTVRMPLLVGSHKVRLLPPWDLAKYMIVVTTFSRCEEEFRKEVGVGNLDGSVVKKRRRTNPESGSTRSSTRHNIHPDDDANHQIFHSSLLNMRWLRVVVDEGHELGTHEGGNGVTRFIHQIAAERRWVLSGTPTTGDEDDSEFSAKALDQLQRLLLFLRHPVYGTMPRSDETTTTSMYVSEDCEKVDRHHQNQKQRAKEAWVERVKNPFLQKLLPGRKELLQVLRSVAVLHRKEVINLPKPIFRNIEVNVLVPGHIQEKMRSHSASSVDILETYLKTDEFQGLVDQEQGNHILGAIQKAKEELQERGGPLETSNQAVMRMMMSNDAIKSKDRRPIKAIVYSSNQSNLRDVTEVLFSKLSLENIAEAYDDPDFDSGSELARFRHNIKDVRCCPVCAHQNEFTGTAKESRKPPKCQNFLLEVVKRGDSGVRFLVEAERVVRAVPVAEGGNVTRGRLDGLPHSKYSVNRKAWRDGDILEVNIMDPHPLLKRRESYEQWQEWGVDKCIELAQQDSYRGKDWFFGPLPEGENGAQTMEVTLRKWQRCGSFHNQRQGGWYQGPRLAEVPLKPIHENTFILALDAGLAHGLDLSFVTHIFLLEPIDNAALLEQITSRAHRLGATGPVVVETVNPYYKLDPITEMEQDQEVVNKGGPDNKLVITKRKKDALTKAVCQYCYRQFASMEKAVAHENKQCARNPENVDVVDPWHVSSVYREIRPPPPHTTTTQ